MKKLIVPLFLSLLCLNASAQDLRPRICPQPRQCDISATEYFPIETLTIECPDTQAISWASSHLGQWYGKFAPKVIAQRGGKGMADGSYELSVGDKGVRVTAGTIQGVRYALYSLRQIAIPARGTKIISGWIAPRTEVSDSCASAFRGIHICWFHETDPQEVERLVRLAAYYKLNYAVIEPWGSFRSDVAPWYGWNDGTMTKEEIARIKAVADDLGITLIPQLNVFGHATMSRDGSGKHAALEFSPEYQPLFEPAAGWNWCLSNPETRKLLVDLIGELHAAFGHPSYFHIGCDEADPPSCPDCLAVPYSRLFLDHLNAMSDAVVALGARPMMWHDMLLERGDSRWKGFYCNGSPDTAEATKDLPRDIVICDWFYGGEMAAYPTLDYFKGLGFDVLTCPWCDVSGIRMQGAYAASSGLHGVLGTLWHHYFGEDIVNIYTNLANICWNADPAASNYPYRRYFLTHLRQIGWDMGLTDPRHTGLYFDELPVEPVLVN